MRPLAGGCYAANLGSMARGFCIFRGDAKTSYLESAPVQFFTDPAGLAPVTDDQLAELVD